MTEKHETMSQKLTIQRAALYCGCDVITKYDEGKLYEMVGLSTDMGKLQLLTGNYTYWWDVDKCQLALTPLDKITDEHAIEVAKICGFSSWQTGKGMLRLAIEKGALMFGHSTHKQIIDLLRSLGYDCDNAIQDGWAVDKTTLI